MIVRGARGLLLGAFLIAVAACGGSASANDPSGVVQAALGAASSGGFSKLADYTCAAHKNDIANAFGGGNLSALQAAGVNLNDLFNSMSIKFDNVATKETSRTDTAATVHVTGSMTISIDKDKMRAVMKTMLAAQGQPADDATLDSVMGMMSSQLSQTQQLNSDVQVVNEGGKWLICG